MFGAFKKKRKNPKAVVIGLDGVPYSLIREYMDRGIMPEFARLCQTGQLARMKSSLPEVSSVAWTNFMTGKNPAEHGIFGFMEINKQSYDYIFPNFASLKEMPFWDKENIKTVAINIPQTYPARPMNGVVVSGFVALDLKKATYPESVYNYLRSIEYRLDVNARLAAENPEAFFEDLFKTFRKRIQAIEYLYDHEEWQLFIGTVTETDRMHHFFFDSALVGNHFDIFEKFYRELDQFIGKMAKKAVDDNAVFLTCSDHGFTTIKREVYLNTWLVENGYLNLGGQEGLKGMDSRVKAFCLDPSRIYIHSSGRYAKGSVNASDYRTLVEELAQGLKTITFDGQPVIKEVYLKDEIFHGGLKEDAPDLYLLPNYGFDLKGALNKPSLFGTTHFKGMHTYDDAHFFLSEGEMPNNPKIENIAAVLSAHLKIAD
ncbi:alkaline phosphatase family protein [Desulforhabdus amnigena]|jgi:predicted AlkP superfamily phosphohydrolase/phosphomutase|uniref:Phosphodiesterase n=1 Tax=Desulforhabdus amnigena TaxID=40218 RepID=A0A9W6D3B6_9BACT|nr:alkaline phosphatase family protein [Desulforhabdus amnigena]GLI33415.1 phosphodiesterase [Desulforhabdus amnigena]